ncbi:MAG: glycosyltransferase family 4 protein [bacterium]
MRIVIANKFHYLKGGAERYVFDLRDLLVRHGHETVPFAMRDGRNEPSQWDRHFVSSVRTDASPLSWSGLRTAGRYLYSFEARRKFDALLRESKPDLVHVHNIYHQISPSILPVAKRHGLPVVLTAHDYGLVAPNYGLFHDGRICEHTRPDRYWEAVRHRCVRGSAAASALCAAELSLHRRLGLWRDNVDRIIAPSAFAAAMLEDYGIDPARIVQVPHFIDVSGWEPTFGGGYALYVGRLSPEKGIETLVRAAALSHEVPVRVVGIGPDEARLRRLAEDLGARNVTFVGYRTGDDLRQEYSGARFMVVPSMCYETFGLTVLEGYAAGKPAVVSQMGGLGEVVDDGGTGLMVSAGDAEDLAAAIGRLWGDPAACEIMGRNGRHLAENAYSPEPHYRRIMQVYEEALQDVRG